MLEITYQDVLTVYQQLKNKYDLTENEKSGLSGRRSLYAVKDIKKGDKFTEENVRSIRPSSGLKPKYYTELLGREAKRDYEFGDPIGMGEISI